MDSQEQAHLEQTTTPAKRPRVTFTGFSLEELDPAKFSFAGLDHMGQLAVKDLAIATNDAVNALRQIIEALPFGYNVDNIRDGLLTITNRLYRITASPEPVGYLTGGINRGIRNTRRGIVELEKDIAMLKIENPDLRVGINQLDSALDDAETNLAIIDESLNG